MSRWVILMLVLGACDKGTLAVDTFDVDTLDVDTSDVDTDTEADTGPLTDVTRVQPVGGGSRAVSSERYDLTVTVGTPVHSTVLASESYRLTVGVVAPNP